MIHLWSTIWLTVLWAALWRSTTPATLLSGVVLGSLLSWSMRRADDHRERHRVRPLALLRYLGHMAVALVRSNAAVAWEILTPTDHTRPGILEVRLPRSSELVLTVIANSVSLTPGTLTLQVDPETSTLTLHALHLRDVDAARADVLELHRLVSAALVHADTVREVAT